MFRGTSRSCGAPTRNDGTGCSAERRIVRPTCTAGRSPRRPPPLPKPLPTPRPPPPAEAAADPATAAPADPAADPAAAVPAAGRVPRNAVGHRFRVPVRGHRVPRNPRRRPSRFRRAPPQVPRNAAEPVLPDVGARRAVFRGRSGARSPGCRCTSRRVPRNAAVAVSRGGGYRTVFRGARSAVFRGTLPEAVFRVPARAAVPLNAVGADFPRAGFPRAAGARPRSAERDRPDAAKSGP